MLLRIRWQRTSSLNPSAHDTDRSQFWKPTTRSAYNFSSNIPPRIPSTVRTPLSRTPSIYAVTQTSPAAPPLFPSIQIDRQPHLAPQPPARRQPRHAAASKASGSALFAAAPPSSPASASSSSSKGQRRAPVPLWSGARSWASTRRCAMLWASCAATCRT